LTGDFSRLDAALRRGEWQSQWTVGTPVPRVCPELGKPSAFSTTAGSAIARRARAFDMKICAISPRCQSTRRRPARRHRRPGDEVLQRSDYVTISMPATPKTVGLIGWRQLELMKPTAFLINVARAEIVDEVALYDALAQRSIAGAALDVWYRYPRRPAPQLRRPGRSTNCPRGGLTDAWPSPRPTSPVARQRREQVAFRFFFVELRRIFRGERQPCYG
jgi:lactate dehydrogenase-like 2-hydroxyacid dehydrogenase